mmetsp:Transcript_16813/g.43476  ORF Transcript_16813/g.43476 Transcript_16813/m.43476 type:complete len:258 (-) Transcript_16813:58-831(-)
MHFAVLRLGCARPQHRACRGQLLGPSIGRMRLGGQFQQLRGRRARHHQHVQAGSILLHSGSEGQQRERIARWDEDRHLHAAHRYAPSGHAAEASGMLLGARPRPRPRPRPACLHPACRGFRQPQRGRQPWCARDGDRRHRCPPTTSRTVGLELLGALGCRRAHTCLVLCAAGAEWKTVGGGACGQSPLGVRAAEPGPALGLPAAPGAGRAGGRRESGRRHGRGGRRCPDTGRCSCVSRWCSPHVGPSLAAAAQPPSA